MKNNWILCGVALLTSSLSCWAGTVSDILTVKDGGGIIVGQVILFEDGTFSGLNAACYNGDTSLSNLCGLAENPRNIYYINDATLVDQTLNFGPGTDPPSAYYLTENGINSDLVGLSTPDSGNTTVLSFASDNETSGVDSILFGVFPTQAENGVFSATRFLDPTLVTQGYTADFTSFDTPEPGSMALLALGLGALVFGRFRRN